MDKPIWKQFQEQTNSFEEVLQLASKFILVDLKYLRYLKSVDFAYKNRQIFTIKEWKKLYDIGLLLWYQQHSKSCKLLNHKYFSQKLQPGYQESINFWFEKNKLIHSSDRQYFRDEGLKAWKKFIGELSYISYVEQQFYGQQARKKQKKLELNPDLLFAILTAIAMVIGIGLAILVISSRR